jgi:hypothetical protein
MSDFQIAGPTRDLVFVRGDFVIVRAAEARRQRIDIAMHHMMGEWFLDENAGTDYFGKVLGKTRDLTRRAEIRRRVLSVPGVVDVTAMQLVLDPRTRALSGTVTALDITGAPIDVVIEGVT